MEEKPTQSKLRRKPIAQPDPDYSEIMFEHIELVLRRGAAHDSLESQTSVRRRNRVSGLGAETKAIISAIIALSATILIVGSFLEFIQFITLPEITNNPSLQILITFLFSCFGISVLFIVSLALAYGCVFETSITIQLLAALLVKVIEYFFNLRLLLLLPLFPFILIPIAISKYILPTRPYKSLPIVNSTNLAYINACFYTFATLSIILTTFSIYPLDLFGLIPGLAFVIFIVLSLSYILGLFLFPTELLEYQHMSESIRKSLNKIDSALRDFAHHKSVYILAQRAITAILKSIFPWTLRCIGATCAGYMLTFPIYSLAGSYAAQAPMLLIYLMAFGYVFFTHLLIRSRPISVFFHNIRGFVFNKNSLKIRISSAIATYLLTLWALPLIFQESLLGYHALSISISLTFYFTLATLVLFFFTDLLHNHKVNFKIVNTARNLIVTTHHSTDDNIFVKCMNVLRHIKQKACAYWHVIGKTGRLILGINFFGCILFTALYTAALYGGLVHVSHTLCPIPNFAYITFTVIGFFFIFSRFLFYAIATTDSILTLHEENKEFRDYYKSVVEFPKTVKTTYDNVVNPLSYYFSLSEQHDSQPSQIATETPSSDQLNNG